MLKPGLSEALPQPYPRAPEGEQSGGLGVRAFKLWHFRGEGTSGASIPHLSRKEVPLQPPSDLAKGKRYNHDPQASP